MVYADQMRRRETDRARYWAKKGLPVPNGDGSSSQPVSSVPEFVPRNEKIPEFQAKGRARSLARVENWSRSPYWKPVGYGIAGLVLIVGAGLFGYKYQNEIRDRLKGLSLVRNRGEEDPFPETTKANNAMAGLLDFAQDVMNRANIG